MRVYVKENAADARGIRQHAPFGCSWKVWLAAADDINDGGGVDVLAVVVAVLDNVAKLLLVIRQLLLPLALRRLRIVPAVKWRETTLSRLLQKLEVRFVRANYDDAIAPNEFAQRFERVVDGVKVRHIRVQVPPRPRQIAVLGA